MHHIVTGIRHSPGGLLVDKKLARLRLHAIRNVGLAPAGLNLQRKEHGNA
jgi:hypothetical protein